MDEITVGEYDNLSFEGTDALIFTKNECSNCEETQDLMGELGISFTVVNMDEQPAARLAVKKMGFRQAPVVITRDTKWSGLNESAIRDLANGDDVWG